MTRFQKTSVAATVATFLLIGVGGFVRAAGAGLGCPDWPRCFERWIPPTDAAQLPAHIDPAAFNFTLAWIEYVNRLIGVGVGLLILAVAVVAWRDHRRRPVILRPAVATVLLVAFQGWFGGQVVAYELDPRFVTVHLLVAYAIAALLLHLVVEGFDVDAGDLPRPPAVDAVPFWIATLALAVAVVQIVLGALVRGSLDVLFDADPQLARGAAMAMVGSVDAVHRTTGLAVLASCAGLFWVAQTRLRHAPALRRWVELPAWLAVAQFAFGIGLVAWDLPPALQLLHLAGSSWLFGALVFAVLLLQPARAPIRTVP